MQTREQMRIIERLKGENTPIEIKILDDATIQQIARVLTTPIRKEPPRRPVQLTFVDMSAGKYD